VSRTPVENERPVDPVTIASSGAFRPDEDDVHLTPE